MSGARGFVLVLLASILLAILFYPTILFEGWLARGDWTMNCDYYHLESRGWRRIAVADAPLSREHRPPLTYTTPVRGTQVELRKFTPNRLVYSVRTPRPQLIPLPFQWQQHDEWTLEGFVARKHRDRMAVSVPAGWHEIEMRFRPRLLGAGIAVSAVTLCAVAASFALPRRSRQRLLDALGGPEVLARDASTGRLPGTG